MADWETEAGPHWLAPLGLWEPGPLGTEGQPEKVAGATCWTVVS